jgi:hypothetical protein
MLVEASVEAGVLLAGSVDRDKTIGDVPFCILCDLGLKIAVKRFLPASEN